MKIKYPIEAFALIYIIFSHNVQNALIAGILCILITLLGCVMKQCTNNIEPTWCKPLILWITIITVTYSLFLIVFNNVLRVNITKEVWYLQIMIGILIAKFITINNIEENSLDVAKESGIAYGCLIAIALLREFLSLGSIMGYTIAEYSFITEGFQSTMAAFLFAGTGIALTNFIIKKGMSNSSSYWVILPVIVLYRPLTLESQANWIRLIVGILLPILFLISIKKRLTFSCLSRAFKKLPIDLVSTGFIYMILIGLKF